jgi:hypothetical protein
MVQPRVAHVNGTPTAWAPRPLGASANHEAQATAGPSLHEAVEQKTSALQQLWSPTPINDFAREFAEVLLHHKVGNEIARDSFVKRLPKSLGEKGRNAATTAQSRRAFDLAVQTRQVGEQFVNSSAATGDARPTQIRRALGDPAMVAAGLVMPAGGALILSRCSCWPTVQEWPVRNVQRTKAGERAPYRPAGRLPLQTRPVMQPRWIMPCVCEVASGQAVLLQGAGAGGEQTADAFHANEALAKAIASLQLDNPPR